MFPRMIAAVLAAFFAITAMAPAHASHKDRTVCQKAAPLRAKVVKKFTVRKAGRDICKYGMLITKGERKGETRPTTYKERDRYRDTLKRLLAPPPALLARTAVPPAQAPAGTYSASVAAPAGGTLDAIARCESGGNPRAVDSSGTYRGKYQFDMQTWASVGGSGDPAAASEAEQDRRAAMLYARSGSSPWPVCG